MDTEYTGAIKIKDGLFIGDKSASQDLDFLVSSKVTHIINTSRLEVNDEWNNIGITYLSFSWQDNEDQILFDETNNNFELCYNFIETALENGESVLIHSVKGESRSVCVVLAYFMKKYKWALTKALEFLNSRKPDCKVKPNFLFQLVKLENWLGRCEGRGFARTWDKTEDPDEFLLRNTFLNSRAGAFVQSEVLKTSRKPRLKWTDGGKLDKNKLEAPNIKNPIENGFIILKSCIKGNDNTILVQQKPSVKCSKSCNTLSVKNFSDSAKEYGSFEDLKVRKSMRTNSDCKRENSPLLRDFRKNVQKVKKKIHNFNMFGFIEIQKPKPVNNPRPRTGSARPASPYIKREKEGPVKSQILKPTWKF